MPTKKEWLTLADNLGGMTAAGRKMKEAVFSYWQLPNTDVTNESGFIALADGYIDYELPDGVYLLFNYGIDSVARFWTVTQPADAVPDEFGYNYGYHVELSYNNSRLTLLY